jgi:hypothetical protein
LNPRLELSHELRNNLRSCVTRKPGAMTTYFFRIDPYLTRRVD